MEARTARISDSFLGRQGLRLAVALAIQFSIAGVAGAATYHNGTSLVRQTIDESQRVSMAGHLKPQARPEADAGMVSSSMSMSQMQLVFRRSPAQNRALRGLLAEQNDRNSSNYHQWVTPAQFGAQFGASDSDIAAAAAWLSSKGFKVGSVPAGHTYLPFSGNASQAQDAFQTEVHYFNVGNRKHFAPISNPSIPVALGDLVAAIGGLNDFQPKPNVSVKHTGAQADFTTVDGDHHVVPGDIAAIYNLNTLYQSGINGAGVTVAIAAQSDVDPTVTQAYWTATGAAPSPLLISIPVPADQGGVDPGQTNDGNETEAYLDTELVGGLAPAATIVLVRDQSAVYAAQYAVESNLAPVLNISFGACEHDLGNDGNSQVAAIYQQAAAEGITVVVSSGDQGVATCDTPLAFTSGQGVVTGLSVNGLASTPFNVAVGGTDFNLTQPQNWSANNDPVTLASAQSYIPEDVWNTSCANPDYVSYLGEPSAEAFCNSQTASDLGLNEIGGGGGGLSGCAFLSSDGACVGGYPQPVWQQGVYGISATGTRSVPDIALLADDFLVCDQEQACDPNNSGYVVLQGTSGAAPTMAAMVALADQLSGPQGNLNPLLYALGSAQYGTADAPNQDSLNACNASNGAGIGSNCIFNDVTAGSTAQPCSVDEYTGAPSGSLPLGSCFSQPGDALGTVQLNGVDVFPAAYGYDLATGLGSLNGSNFVIATYQIEHGLAAQGQAQAQANAPRTFR
jgi:subtilase family serine protease